MKLLLFLFLIIPIVFSCDSTVCEEAKQLFHKIWEFKNSSATKQLKEYFTKDFNIRLCDMFSVSDIDVFFHAAIAPLEKLPKILKASVETIPNSTIRSINFDIEYNPKFNFQLSAKEVNGKLKIYKGYIISPTELAYIQRKCDTMDCVQSKNLFRNLWKFRTSLFPYFRLFNFFTFDFKFTECDMNGGGILDRGNFYFRHVAFNDYLPTVFNATSYTLKVPRLMPYSSVDGGLQQEPIHFVEERYVRSFFSKNHEGQYFHLKTMKVDGKFKFYEGSCIEQNC